MPITQESLASSELQALGVDEIVRDITAIIDAVETLETEVAGMSGGSDYTETIVNISSAQILNMGSSPVELLPAPGVGKYYDWYAIVEVSAGNTPYTYSTASNIYFYGGNVYVEYTPITCTSDSVFKIYDTQNKGITIDSEPGVLLNQAVVMSTDDSSNPTLGDGTMRVKIYHKTITFGA